MEKTNFKYVWSSFIQPILNENKIGFFHLLEDVEFERISNREIWDDHYVDFPVKYTKENFKKLNHLQSNIIFVNSSSIDISDLVALYDLGILMKEKSQFIKGFGFDTYTKIWKEDYLNLQKSPSFLRFAEMYRENKLGVAILTLKDIVENSAFDTTQELHKNYKLSLKINNNHTIHIPFSAILHIELIEKNSPSNYYQSVLDKAILQNHFINCQLGV